MLRASFIAFSKYEYAAFPVSFDGLVREESSILKLKSSTIFRFISSNSFWYLSFNFSKKYLSPYMIGDIFLTSLFFRAFNIIVPFIPAKSPAVITIVGFVVKIILPF